MYCGNASSNQSAGDDDDDTRGRRLLHKMVGYVLLFRTERRRYSPVAISIGTTP
jgi:hypothetical protein